MSKVIAVVRREFVERVRTKAFVASTLLLPVLIAALAVLPAILLTGGDRTMRIAVVDGSSSHLGAEVKRSLDSEKLTDQPGSASRYEVTLVSAQGHVEESRNRLISRTDVSDGKPSDVLDGVLVITDDTFSNGALDYFGRNVSSVETMSKLESSVTEVLATSRLAASGIAPALTRRAMQRANMTTVKVSDGKITGQSGSAAFLVAYFMGFILYLSIMLFGQQTMVSVIEEKTSRIMEVLVASLTPFQMLLGKVLGVGLAGLTQVSIWGGTVFILSSQRGNIASALGLSVEAMQSIPIPTMPFGLLVVFLIYFALGFLLFGALYAAIGAMCNTIQETQQYAIFVTVLILLGFMSVFAVIKDPSGGLGVTTSLLPFFSPFVMPVRWSLTTVPWTHLVVSLLMMSLALLACIWIAARIYRAGILMFGKKPSWSEVYRWIREA